MTNVGPVIESKSTHKQLMESVNSISNIDTNEFSGQSLVNLNHLSAVSLLEHLLIKMSQYQASDLHIEPYKKNYRIRFRIDGLLHTYTDLTLELMDKVILRVKVLAQLNISKQVSAQDGKFCYDAAQLTGNMYRVSIIPLYEGEKIVIRQVIDHSNWAQLSKLGLLKEQMELLMKILCETQGMILVTGATGSGKSMTLYSCLNHLNQEHKNICSVEDPVELMIDGVNQVQINEQAGFYFSDSLKSFLRQDPDAVMVGEIRDSETAQVAIKASQTGHLVLSSLHTSSGHGAISRLQNLGISQCFINENTALIIAQRLVRCLCSHCKQEVSLPPQQAVIFPELVGKKLFKAGGCQLCYKGYKGREGAFELLTYNHKSNSFQSKISLKQALLMKVMEGVTSMQELSRHVNPI